MSPAPSKVAPVCSGCLHICSGRSGGPSPPAPCTFCKAQQLQHSLSTVASPGNFRNVPECASFGCRSGLSAFSPSAPVLQPTPDEGPSTRWLRPQGPPAVLSRGPCSAVLAGRRPPCAPQKTVVSNLTPGTKAPSSPQAALAPAQRPFRRV